MEGSRLSCERCPFVDRPDFEIDRFGSRVPGLPEVQQLSLAFLRDNKAVLVDIDALLSHPSGEAEVATLGKHWLHESLALLCHAHSL